MKIPRNTLSEVINLFMGIAKKTLTLIKSLFSTKQQKNENKQPNQAPRNSSDIHIPKDKLVEIREIRSGSTLLAVLEIKGCVLKKCREKSNAEYSISESDLQGITSIGDSAFSSCKNLKEVAIPGSVENLGSFAFYCCTSLIKIHIPSSVRSIGDSAFAHCETLHSIKVENGVTSIGDSAFSSCTSLKEVAIDGSVTSIGNCIRGYGNLHQKVKIE